MGGGDREAPEWGGGVLLWYLAQNWTCWTISNLPISYPPFAACQKFCSYNNIRDKGLWVSKLPSGTITSSIPLVCGWGNNRVWGEEDGLWSETPGGENLISTTGAASLSLCASISTTTGYFEALIRWLRHRIHTTSQFRFVPSSTLGINETPLFPGKAPGCWHPPPQEANHRWKANNAINDYIYKNINVIYINDNILYSHV